MKKKRPYIKFGNRLRELRGSLTQKEFAKAVGLSTNGYQRYEHGQRRPSLETLLRISAFCDIRVDSLVTDEFGIDFLSNSFAGLNKNLWANEKESEDFIRDIQQLKIEGHDKRLNMGRLPEGEEFYWIEPRLTEAVKMLNYIFSHGSEKTIEYVMEILDFVSKAVATVDFGQEGAPVIDSKKKKGSKDKKDQKR